MPWSIEFEVSKQRKIDALTALGPDHVYVQKKVYNARSTKPMTALRSSYPDFFLWVFDDYKKLSRRFVNGLSQRQAKVFLDAFVVFDGHCKTENATENAYQLFTSEPHTRDDLVTIAVMAGYHPSVRERHNSTLSDRASWDVCFHTGKDTRHLRKQHISRESFRGTLYCVRVPQGRIIVRGGPTSAPVVIGNCAAYVGYCLEEAGVRSTRSAAARSYERWGVKLDQRTAPIGSVAVFRRGSPSGWQGHVGFLVGWDQRGRPLVQGGNQGDMVSTKPFDRGRLVGLYWPQGIPVPSRPAPVIRSDASPSTQEA